jgi:hypothetical protein
MCHSRKTGPFFAILAVLSILHSSSAGAQSAGPIERQETTCKNQPASGPQSLLNE